MATEAWRPITDASFDSEVLKVAGPVLVEFWAQWCPACPLLDSRLEEIAAEHSEQLRMRRLNIDENPETVSTYQVSGFPTIGVFYRGSLVKTIVGAQPKTAIVEQIAEFIE
jgi:thioredoxin 1